MYFVEISAITGAILGIASVATILIKIGEFKAKVTEMVDEIGKTNCKVDKLELSLLEHEKDNREEMKTLSKDISDIKTSIAVILEKISKWNP